ncbi:MAG: hypothetical protein ACI9MC_003215 [Kiritimatiellia bacterium]|jgi:hypothetical protein
MIRVLILLAVAACNASGNSETDASDTDSDTTLPTCSYPELAGDWWSDSVTSRGEQIAVDSTATFRPTAEEGAEFGGMRFVGSWEGVAYDCVERLICTGRDQNEWRVGMSSTEDDEPCAPGWVFIKPESNGTLRYEWGEAEFGERLTTIELTRD